MPRFRRPSPRERAGANDASPVALVRPARGASCSSQPLWWGAGVAFAFRQPVRRFWAGSRPGCPCPHIKIPRRSSVFVRGSALFLWCGAASPLRIASVRTGSRPPRSPLCPVVGSRAGENLHPRPGALGGSSFARPVLLLPSGCVPRSFFCRRPPQRPGSRRCNQSANPGTQIRRANPPRPSAVIVETW